MIQKPGIRISLIGAGRAGCAVARLLSRFGYIVNTIIDINPEKAKKCAEYVRAEDSSSSVGDLDLLYDLLIISVPDSRISEVSEEVVRKFKIRRDAVIVHLSGLLSSQILNKCKEAGAFTGSMHPCMTFTDNFSDNKLNCYVALEGDRRSVELLDGVIKRIGGNPFVISQEDKILYHAGCTIASNYVVTLLDFAKDVTDKMSGDIPAESFLHLARKSVENFFMYGSVNSLTGPIVRGDVDTVKKHIKALIKRDQELAVVYSILGKRSLEIAKAQGTNLQKINEMKLIFDDVIKKGIIFDSD